VGERTSTVTQGHLHADRPFSQLPQLCHVNRNPEVCMLAIRLYCLAVSTAQLQNELAKNWMTEIPQGKYFLNRNTLLYSNIA